MVNTRKFVETKYFLFKIKQPISNFSTESGLKNKQLKYWSNSQVAYIKKIVYNNNMRCLDNIKIYITLLYSYKIICIKFHTVNKIIRTTQ